MIFEFLTLVIETYPLAFTLLFVVPMVSVIALNAYDLYSQNQFTEVVTDTDYPTLSNDEDVINHTGDLLMQYFRASNGNEFFELALEEYDQMSDPCDKTWQTLVKLVSAQHIATFDLGEF